jgi:hypothetical protein
VKRFWRSCLMVWKEVRFSIEMTLVLFVGRDMYALD